VPAYVLIRRITVGSLSIRLWIDADDNEPCAECEERADELALCASTLADEDDDAMMLADKLARTLRLAAVEVLDDSGNGGLVYPDSE